MSLTKTFGWTLVGNASYALAQWATVIIIAKLGTQAMVGEFALAWALTTPFIVLSGLQLRNVLVSDSRGIYSFAEYLRLRVSLTALAMIGVVVFAFVGNYSSHTRWVIVSVGAAKALDSLSDIYYGRWQRNERMQLVSEALVVNAGSTLLAVAAAMLLWGDVAIAAAASMLGSLVTLAFVLARERRGFPSEERVAHGEPWNSTRLFRLAWEALPLGIVMLFVSLQASIPRLFLERHLGAAELGMFSAVAQLTLAGSNVVTALGSSASSRLARLVAGGDVRAFHRLVWGLFAFGVSLGLAGAALSVLAGEAILTLLYRPEYASAARILIWLSLAAGLSYGASFLGYGMTMARRLRPQAPLFAAVVVTSLVSSAVLIPAHGVVGAVLALVVPSAVQIAGSVWILNSKRGFAIAAEGNPQTTNNTESMGVSVARASGASRG